MSGWVPLPPCHTRHCEREADVFCSKFLVNAYQKQRVSADGAQDISWRLSAVSVPLRYDTGPGLLLGTYEPEVH